MRQDMLDNEIHSHKFGVIEFRTKGAGVFVPSDKLTAQIQTLTLDEVKKINSDAWVLKRKYERLCSKYNNVSLFGSDIYDRASHMESVADKICKLTYKRIRS